MLSANCAGSCSACSWRLCFVGCDQHGFEDCQNFPFHQTIYHPLLVLPYFVHLPYRSILVGMSLSFNLLKCFDHKRKSFTRVSFSSPSCYQLSLLSRYLGQFSRAIGCGFAHRSSHYPCSRERRVRDGRNFLANCPTITIISFSLFMLSLSLSLSLIHCNCIDYRYCWKHGNLLKAKFFGGFSKLFLAPENYHHHHSSSNGFVVILLFGPTLV